MTTGRRLAAYEALLQRVEALTDAHPREDLVAQLASAVRDTVPFDLVAVWVYDAADQMLRQVMLEGASPPPSSTLQVPVDFGPAGRAFQSQSPVVLQLEAKPAPPIASILFDAGFRALCIVPASTAETRHGVLGIAGRDVARFS